MPGGGNAVAMHTTGEVLPLLYLHGLSSGDFVPALAQFLACGAGLSASLITELTATWKAESLFENLMPPVASVSGQR